MRRGEFYTEIDIIDMVRAGKRSLVLNEDDRITDVARERAIKAGFNISRPPSEAAKRPEYQAPSMSSTRRSGGTSPAGQRGDIHQRVRKAVQSKLGQGVDRKADRRHYPTRARSIGTSLICCLEGFLDVPSARSRSTASKASNSCWSSRWTRGSHPSIASKWLPTSSKPGRVTCAVLTRSREAALAMRDETFVPVDLAIVGVVDELVVREGIDIGLAPGYNTFT